MLHSFTTNCMRPLSRWGKGPAMQSDAIHLPLTTGEDPGLAAMGPLTLLRLLRFQAACLPGFPSYGRNVHAGEHTTGTARLEQAKKLPGSRSYKFDRRDRV